MTELRLQVQHSKSGWPLRVKVLRVLWAPCSLVFLHGTGRLLSPLRVAALKLFGAKVTGKVLSADDQKRLTEETNKQLASN